MAQTFNLRPGGESSTYNTWTLGAGASKTAAVDPGNPVSHDDATSYISVTRTTSTRQAFTLLTAGRPDMAQVISVEAFCRWRNINNPTTAQELNIFARRNGTDGANLVLDNNNGSFGNGDVQGTLPRPGGGSWTAADLLDPGLELGCYVSTWQGPTNPNEVQVTSLYIIVTYEPVPAQISQVRERASFRLMAFRRETAHLTAVVRAKFLDLELLDDAALAHFGLPMHNALGIGAKDWKKPAFRLLRKAFDPGTMQLAIVAKDLRNQLVTFWDGGRSLKTSGATLDGIPRLDGGCTRLWTRSSKAWHVNPTDGRVHESRNDEERIDSIGMLFESSRTNGITRSSFISQLTGWGTTTGVTAVSAESNSPLFEAGITDYLAKIDSNPISPRGPTSPASVSYSGGTKISVSVDYREGEADTALKVHIVRIVDGRYWDGSAWQVAQQDLAVTASTVNARAKWENIDVGASATTVTVRPVILASSSKTAYISHVQVEAGAWASTRIVTDASTVTRNYDQLKVSNNSGRRCWNAARGTLFLRYRRAWSGAPTSPFYLLDLTYDASNWFRLYFDMNAKLLNFEMRVAGTTYTASKAFDPAANTTYRLAIRWCSSSGEMNLSPYAISVFIDGVKGTDAIGTNTPTEASPSDLYIGGNSAASISADGNVFDIIHTQQVLRDDEVARGW